MPRVITRLNLRDAFTSRAGAFYHDRDPRGLSFSLLLRPARDRIAKINEPDDAGGGNDRSPIWPVAATGRRMRDRSRRLTMRMGIVNRARLRNDR